MASRKIYSIILPRIEVGFYVVPQASFPTILKVGMLFARDLIVITCFQKKWGIASPMLLI